VKRITQIRSVTVYQQLASADFLDLGTVLFGKPLHTPHQVRGRPFRDHAANFEDGIMSTRRKAYWWFWFVASGRFLETFLNLRGKRG